MKRLPVLPTLIVLLACGIMIALGFWQLRRADEKAAMVARFEAAATLPEMAYPSVPLPAELPLFRTSSINCATVQGWRTKAGRNLKGESGWAHIAACGTGAEGPGVAVEAGWSRTPDKPVWGGGPVSGVITTDDISVIRLVSREPLAPDLVASAPPSPANIPNNHLSYAVQWFAFAAIAMAIYLLALRRRWSA